MAFAFDPEVAKPSSDDLAGQIEPAYFRWMSLTTHSADRAAAIVRQHLNLGSTRYPGQAMVRVHQSDDDSGIGPAIQVVNDDMPHLVDTISAALRRTGCNVVQIVHPIFDVLRDPHGDLLTIKPSTGSSTGTIRESWIHLQLAADSSLSEGVEQQLLGLLADLRVVATDAAAMTIAMQEAAQSLQQAGGDLADAALLRWLADGRFIPLGAARIVQRSAEPMPQFAAGLGIFNLSANTLSLPINLENPQPGLQLTAGSISSPLAGTSEPFLIRIANYEAAEENQADTLFLGFLAAAALHENILDIPMIADRARKVVSAAGFELNSFTGQAILEILQAYPRAELFTTDTPHLLNIVSSVLNADLRRQVQLYVRYQPESNAIYCLIYLARDRYSSAVRGEMQAILQSHFDIDHIEYSARVTDADHAVLYFTLLRDLDSEPFDLPEADRQQLEAALFAATRTWSDRFQTAATIEGLSRMVIAEHLAAIPASYSQEHEPAEAIADLHRLAGLDLGQIDTDLTQCGETDSSAWRFSLYAVGDDLSLSRVLPVLHSLGVEVVDEHPYRFAFADGQTRGIYRFGIRPLHIAATTAGDSIETEGVFASIRARFTEAFTAVWTERAEADDLNALVLRAGLDWPRVRLLRAYAKYLRQTGFPYSFAYITRVLLAYPEIAGDLTELFHAMFDPDIDPSATRGRTAIEQAIGTAIDNITELDADRVLRTLLNLVLATLRTNHFRHPLTEPAAEQLAFKLDTSRIPELPLPKPWVEIFVYSPRVEGVHLRYGAVARGGIRWSDRLADYRTEILGLVKAQAVKNAMIVPVGAKGGFVVKQPPSTTGDSESDRRASLAEGRSCYRKFIAALLDVTDTIDHNSGGVRPPRRVVRLDSDDPYLVVAADKGTATFSDLANEVAHDYGFWLGDAFASGGSAGYDHKAIGITARGAWESVRRHFAELEIDIDRDSFTVAGIGDMSGDVFGNGMLLSTELKLIAAFDHRHIFLDPNPDPAASHAERSRLFDQPRSSWADYDPTLISTGGGVWSRTTKRIPISENARAALALPETITSLAPNELIRAILQAPVDLLWNGGIGTYIKAGTETHPDVGDKSNDAVRVDAEQLRAKVIGEGGNLGLTPRGRIEFCQHGGRCNTDAIDNSGGVDCSDREVNIKIVLDAAVSSGELRPTYRNLLLATMTDDVVEAVLHDNIAQNTRLGISRASSPDLLPVHARMLNAFDRRDGLDRELEALPTAGELARRRAAGLGLTSPELATLTAHIKLSTKTDLLADDLADDPAYESALLEYFPPQIRDRFAPLIRRHPLRREITATALVNDMIDNAGPEYAYGLTEEFGTTATETIHAFHAATEIFGLRQIWQEIRSTPMPTAAADKLELETRQVLERASRWLLSAHSRLAGFRRYHAPIRQLAETMPTWLPDTIATGIAVRAEDDSSHGAPLALAQRVRRLIHLYPLLDIIDSTEILGRAPTEVATLYFTVEHHLGIDRLLRALRAAETTDHWHGLARRTVRDDLYAALRDLTIDAFTTSSTAAGGAVDIHAWHDSYHGRIEWARTVIDDILADGAADIATLSVAARQIRGLIDRRQLSIAQ